MFDEFAFAGTAIRGQFPLDVRGPVYTGRYYQSPGEMQATFETLRELGVSLVWDLLEASSVYAPLLKAEAAAFELVHTPIVDYSVPADGRAFVADLDRVHAHLSDGGGAFVHCAAGRGRTGVALAALAVRAEGIDAETALERTHVAFDGPQSPEQHDFVRELARRLG
jgi:hypothetical protein